MEFTNTRSLTFKDYLSKAFAYLGLGILISAISAYFSMYLVAYLLFYHYNLLTIITFVASFGELGIAFIFTAALNKMKKSTAILCYVLYAVFTGFSLSSLLLIYSFSSVALAFLVTAIMFICMAVIAKTTNIDFTKFSSLLFTGLISMMIVTLLNALIFKSFTIEIVLTYAGIFLFLVIIAMDIQRLREYYNSFFYDSELAQKAVIYGSFQLYLDFINLFIRIIRILGRNRSRD